MSAPEPRRATRPRGETRLTIALWLALLSALPPLLRVVQNGDWLPGAAALSAAILALGFLLRRRRMPAIGLTLVELALWAMAVTLFFFAGSALLGFIPTGAVLAAAAESVQTASSEILIGVAPIEASPALTFVIVASLGLLTVALDHVVLTARMPLLAACALVMVWLIPSIAVPAGIDAVSFVLLAAAVLSLIRAETRTREAPVMASRSAGVTAVATTIGAVAIVGALVVAPALPPPTVGTVGAGVAARIDPALDLGNDLRRRDDVPVLSLRSDAPSLPNLRVATLSVFDGQVWRPDRMRSLALSDQPLEPVTAEEGVRVVEYRTNVAVTQLASAYLPVPYPAVEIDGLQGQWRSVPYSRTVLTTNGSAQGQNYEVVSHVPRPTLEQIRASRAVVQEDRVDLYSLPAETPAIIGELAQQVTAAATSDYDKLVALQSWFRGPEFTYSLTAPVEDGFDDAGAAAVAAFLDEKEGYCIHFAGAFALMARSLGMPTRVVVGFLPGAYTGDTVDGERVAQVTTGQLHAWPEVNFEGVGWVAFEPTKSLGTATRFVSSTSPVDDSGEDVSGATPQPTASSSAGARPDDVPADRQGQASGTTTPALDLRPLLTMLAVAILLAAAPGVAGGLRRMLLRRRGTVAAAWRLVQDTAIDIGVAVPAADTPRAFGVRVSAAGGAPSAAMSRLVAAVERANYAPSGCASVEDAARARQAMTDAEAIRQGMLSALSPLDRVRAVALPRSLVVRPGSSLGNRDAVA